MAQTKEQKATYNREWRKTHREQVAIWNQAWREEHPEYNYTYYEAHREEIAAYTKAHREQKATYDRAWYKAHREERAVSLLAYQIAHPQEMAEKARRHRALKRGATIGPIDLDAIKTRDQMRCVICGKKVKDKELSLDHTVPLSLGGSHSQGNLRVAHRLCNARRGAGRLPVQIVLI